MGADYPGTLARVCPFAVGVRGGVPFLAWLLWWQACFSLVRFRFSADVCGAVLAWRVVSRLAYVVASRTVLTWRAGEGGGLILPALAKSAPTLPSPPRHPGTARCAACGCEGRNAVLRMRITFFRLLPRFRLRVWACGDSPLEAGGRATTSARSRRSPATRLRRQRVKKPWIETAGVHGFARARGEPSDNLCSQCAEDGSPLVRAQREAAPHRQAYGSGDPKHRHHRGQNEHC